jgi:YfiH family protein
VTVSYDNSASLLFSEALSAIPWLVHAVTTRHFNAASENKPEDLPRLAALLNIKPSAIAFCEQVHEDSIALMTDAETANKSPSQSAPAFHVFPHTDAIITNQPATMINVFTADCIPIMIADTQRKIIGVVHAGWKGTLLGIVEKAIQTFRYLHADPADLLVWLGPAIGRCCYTISNDLMAEFKQRFAEFEDFSDGRRLDLSKLNMLQAHRAGVPLKHISSANLCTRCHQDLFFSYRGDPQHCGRMISTMMIRSD